MNIAWWHRFSAPTGHLTAAVRGRQHASCLGTLRGSSSARYWWLVPHDLTWAGFGRRYCTYEAGVPVT